MAVFEYKGFDGAGKAVSGVIDAEAARVARSKLRSQGLFPTELNEQQAGGGATKGKGLSVEVDFSKYIEMGETVMFALRKKYNQITFLHCYHHATMAVIWWSVCKFVTGGQCKW